MTDSKGFTLLEVMISVAIFAIAAYLISDFNQIYTSDNYSMKRACEAQAANIISAVQEQTYYMKIINPAWDSPPDGGLSKSNLTYSASNFSGTSLLADNNDYLTGNANQDKTIYYSPTGVSQYNGHYLIQGSLRTLAAIYNNFGAIQCKMGIYAPLTDGITIPLPGVLANLPSKPVIKMELDPYSLDNHSSLCGTGKLFPAPRNRGGAKQDPKYDIFGEGSGTYLSVPISGPEVSGKEAPNHMSASDIAIAVRAPNTNTDIGISMTVQISYTMKDKNYSCSATQEFQYPEDDSPPPTPNLAEVVSNSTFKTGTPNVLVDYCQGTVLTTTTTGDATIKMGYTGQTLENGTELFCKDLSWIRTPANTTYCKVGAVNVTGQPYDGDAKFFAGTGYQFTDTANPTTQFEKRSRYWQPCQTLTQCGYQPASTSFTQTSNTELTFTNTYSGLPFGCVMNFEVIGVDTAGNRSGERGVGVFLSDTAATHNSSTYGDKNFTARMNEIYYPTCGGGEGYYYTYYHSGLGYYCPTYGYYNCMRWCGS